VLKLQPKVLPKLHANNFAEIIASPNFAEIIVFYNFAETSSKNFAEITLYNFAEITPTMLPKLHSLSLSNDKQIYNSQECSSLA